MLHYIILVSSSNSGKNFESIPCESLQSIYDFKTFNLHQINTEHNNSNSQKSRDYDTLNSTQINEHIPFNTQNSNDYSNSFYYPNISDYNITNFSQKANNFYNFDLQQNNTDHLPIIPHQNVLDKHTFNLQQNNTYNFLVNPQQNVLHNHTFNLQQNIIYCFNINSQQNAYTNGNKNLQQDYVCVNTFNLKKNICDDNNYRFQQNNNHESHYVHNKETKKRTKPYTRTFSEQYIPYYQIRRPSFSSTLAFVAVLRDNYTNITDYNDRRIFYYHLLHQWENEHLDIELASDKLKFPDRYIYYKYRYNSNMTGKWLKNYREILYKDLPQVKNEIEISSVEETYKKIIIENIDSISRAMGYFETLYPKGLSYAYHSEILKFRYKLISIRLPCLYEYFSIIKGFLDLYEMIIEHFIKKIANSMALKSILNNMTINVKIILYNYEDYLKDIKYKLILLENLIEAD
ncbi:uncharacterized protein VNE69_02033 [Vairimorpha necatrix]|uniref:Uncharacterized protein n=1 Tax=Vairimorpha necatrix TaxID=6039 RepID=A0AAX4J979_9MICR